MSYDTIPTELKTEKAWVNVWSTSKIPMQSTKRKAASASDPGTWSTFAEAAQAVEEGYYDGIGYVFHDNGIIGIDIDTGFDDRKLLSSTACDIIKTCASYTEKSRSGRGFHILLKGNLPFKGRNNHKGIEIYRTARFFIMTGKTFLRYTSITDNQPAIDHILSTYFAAEAAAPTPAGNIRQPVIYRPTYSAPSTAGCFKLRPEYPEIQPGARNISLASLAGQLHTQGYSKEAILQEVAYANSVACKPPLPQGEVAAIVNSITRYKRR